MSINTPRSPEKREPKFDKKKGESAADKARYEVKKKVNNVLSK